MKNNSRVRIVRSVMIRTEAGVFIQLVIIVLDISFQLVDESVVVGEVPLPLTLVLKICFLSRAWPIPRNRERIRTWIAIGFLKFLNVFSACRSRLWEV